MIRTGRSQPRDDVGHREGLAGAGHAEQRLVPVARPIEPTSFSIACGWSPVGL
jgi:hypothetical protein